MSGKCGFTANVMAKAYVVASKLWGGGSDYLDLHPMHMGVLFDIDSITVETVEQATRRVGAMGAPQRQAQRAAVALWRAPQTAVAALAPAQHMRQWHRSIRSTGWAEMCPVWRGWVGGGSYAAGCGKRSGATCV